MAEPWEVSPASLRSYHRALMQMNTMQFLHFRNLPGLFDRDEHPEAYELPVPRRAPPPPAGVTIFPNVAPGATTWFDRLSFDRAQGACHIDLIKSGYDISNKRLRRLWLRLRSVKDYFTVPTFKYRRCLGFGGLGMALHYRYTDLSQSSRSGDLVVKVGLMNWSNQELRVEEMEMKKCARAAHVMQVIDPPNIGLPPHRKARRLARQDDSSDEDDRISSGDEDTHLCQPRPPRRRRAELNAFELSRKMPKWGMPPSGRKGYQKYDPENRDFMLLEYAENGDLRTLLAMCKERNRPVPNRMLWRFWLCMVKMCIAMAFPPRKFHPDRRKHQGELDEFVPDPTQHWRMKRMVHFDLDPYNIFIAGLDGTHEHSLFPRLKLGDFGLAEEVKQQKRDSYYVNRRHQGKGTYHAPEQFTEEWDYIPADPNGANVCDQSVAGNYGPPMNIWCIALCMQSLITLAQPRRPPVPGHLKCPTADGGEMTAISYGTWLLENEWDRVDYNLRYAVAACMCHDPDHRPQLIELLRSAEAGCMRDGWPGEDDASIRKWLNDVLFSAPKRGPF